MDSLKNLQGECECSAIGNFKTTYAVETDSAVWTFIHVDTTFSWRTNMHIENDSELSFTVQKYSIQHHYTSTPTFSSYEGYNSHLELDNIDSVKGVIRFSSSMFGTMGTASVFDYEYKTGNVTYHYSYYDPNKSYRNDFYCIKRK